MEHEVLRKKAIIIQSFLNNFVKLMSFNQFGYIQQIIFIDILYRVNHTFFISKKFSLRKCMHVWSLTINLLLLLFFRSRCRFFLMLTCISKYMFSRNKPLLTNHHLFSCILVLFFIAYQQVTICFIIKNFQCRGLIRIACTICIIGVNNQCFLKQ